MESFTSCLSLVMSVMMLTTSSVHGFPRGAPNFLCKSMRPGHPYREQVYSPDTFPFNIDLSSEKTLPGDIVTVTVSVKDPGDTFRGLLATAVDPDFNVVSGFTEAPDPYLKLLNCTWSDRSVENSALTHTDRFPNTTKAKTFQWRIPSNAVLGSMYTIRLTVVRYVTTYWVGVNSTLTIGHPIQPNRPSTVLGTEPLPTDSGNTQLTSSSTHSGSSVPSPTNAGSDSSSTGNASSNTGSAPSSTGSAPANTGNIPSNGGQAGTSSGNGIQARPTSTNDNSKPGNVLERHPGQSNMVNSGRQPSLATFEGNSGRGRATGRAGAGPVAGAGAGNRAESGDPNGAETGAPGMSAWLAGWFGR